jgi:hypothetical protein
MICFVSTSLCPVCLAHIGKVVQVTKDRSVLPLQTQFSAIEIPTHDACV